MLSIKFKKESFIEVQTTFIEHRDRCDGFADLLNGGGEKAYKDGGSTQVIELNYDAANQLKEKLELITTGLHSCGVGAIPASSGLQGTWNSVSPGPKLKQSRFTLRDYNDTITREVVTACFKAYNYYSSVVEYCRGINGGEELFIEKVSKGISDYGKTVTREVFLAPEGGVLSAERFDYLSRRPFNVLSLKDFDC